jgi:hypothetical protein
MSLKAHAARRPEQVRPDLAASAERANLARCKARARTRLGFHNRREVSKSHFAAAHESGIGPFETRSSPLKRSAHGEDGKVGGDGRSDFQALHQRHDVVHHQLVAVGSRIAGARAKPQGRIPVGSWWGLADPEFDTASELP